MKATELLAACPEATGDVVNVGGSNPITVLKLAAKVKAMTGSSSDTVFIPYEKVYSDAFEDMVRGTPAVSRLETLIGFRMQRSLDETLEAVIEEKKETLAQEGRLAAPTLG